MIDKFEMFIALARERHFGRAAEFCNVTQPSLSSAIRGLEDFYGLPLVLRGSRFQGLTPEGERLLERARVIVAETRLIRSELQQARREPEGVLRIGLIPTAQGVIQEMIPPFMARCPKMRVQIRTMSSQAITEALAEFQIDMGISYAEDDIGRLPGQGLEVLPLYRESWAVLAAAPLPPEFGWEDLVRMRLCLLTQDMQNRRILDQRLAACKITPAPLIEASSIQCLVAQVQGGADLMTVLPQATARFFAQLPGLYCQDLPDDASLTSPEVALIMPVEARRGAALSELLKALPAGRSRISARIPAPASA